MPPPENVRGEEQIGAWRLQRAVNVVQGRIVDVRAGEDIVRGGRRVVVGRMKVNGVVKGNVPVGDLTILTMLECGLATFLLAGVALDREVTLEVRAIPELPGEYVIDMCGYYRMPGLAQP
jgi:hypothetical protein